MPSPYQSNMTEEKKEKNKTTWQTRIIDAGDGSGDGFMELPAELVDQLGWREGDVLTLEEHHNGDWEIRIRKR